MDTIPVRIKKTTHQELKGLAETLRKSMQSVLQDALEAYRRQQFFDELDAKAVALKQNVRAWGEELKERRTWETTLTDGLDQEQWSTPKRRRKAGRKKKHG